MQCFFLLFGFPAWSTSMQSYLSWPSADYSWSMHSYLSWPSWWNLVVHHAGPRIGTPRISLCNVIRIKDWHSRHTCLLCWHHHSSGGPRWRWRWCTAGWWWHGLWNVHPKFAQHLVAGFCCSVQIGPVHSQWQALEKGHTWVNDLHFICHDLDLHAVECPHAPHFSISNPTGTRSAHPQFKRWVKGDKSVIVPAWEEQRVIITKTKGIHKNWTLQACWSWQRPSAKSFLALITAPPVV